MSIQKKFSFIFLSLFFLVFIFEFISNPDTTSFWIRLGIDTILFVLIYALVRHFFIKPVGHLKQDLESHLASPFASLKGKHALTSSINPAVNDIIKQHHKAMDDVADSVARLSPMSQELRATYDSIAQKAALQNSHSEVLEQSINQIKQATETLSQQVEAMTKIAADGAETTHQAEQAMSDTITSIHDLSSEITHASSEMTVLKDDSDNIHSILEVIQGIAEQTNLLALNAAIEAARAGEHGRGFAVVADEVRTLAEQTRTSASKVGDMIQSLQSGTNRVVDAMNSSLKKAEDTISKTDYTREQLESMHSIIGRVEDVSHQVNQAMIDQEAADAEAEKSVHSMTHLNEEAFENTHIQAVTADDISALHQVLLDKFEQHGFEKSLWPDNLRDQIRTSVKLP